MQRPYMINRTSGLKQHTPHVNGHAWFHLYGLRRAVRKVKQACLQTLTFFSILDLYWNWLSDKICILRKDCVNHISYSWAFLIHDKKDKDFVNENHLSYSYFLYMARDKYWINCISYSGYFLHDVQSAMMIIHGMRYKDSVNHISYSCMRGMRCKDSVNHISYSFRHGKRYKDNINHISYSCYMAWDVGIV